MDANRVTTDAAIMDAVPIIAAGAASTRAVFINKMCGIFNDVFWVFGGVYL